MACEICTTKRLDNFKIGKFYWTKKVRPNDYYEINIEVECLNWLFPDHASICLYHGNEMIDSYPDQGFSSGEKIEFMFENLMSDEIMDMHISVMDEGISKGCEDYRNFRIIPSDTTEKPTDENGLPQNLFLYAAIIILIFIVIILRWKK